MDALPSLYTIGYSLGENTRQGLHSDRYTEHVHLLLLKIQCINIVHFTVCCIIECLFLETLKNHKDALPSLYKIGYLLGEYTRKVLNPDH